MWPYLAFSDQSKKVLVNAEIRAKKTGYTVVEPFHIVYALLETRDSLVFKYFNNSSMKSSMEDVLNKTYPKNNAYISNDRLLWSEESMSLLELARLDTIASIEDEASAFVSSHHLFFASLKLSVGQYFVKIFDANQLKRNFIVKMISNGHRESSTVSCESWDELFYEKSLIDSNQLMERLISIMEVSGVDVARLERNIHSLINLLAKRKQANDC